MVSLHTGDDTYLFLLCLSGSITENYRIVFHKQRRKKENSVGLKGGVAKLKEVGPRAWNSHLKSLQRSCCDHARQESCYYTWRQAGKRQERKWTQFAEEEDRLSGSGQRSLRRPGRGSKL